MPRLRNYCIIEDCGEPVQGHGLCPKHYLRWKRYGRLELLKEQPRKGQKPRFPLPNLPRRELVIWAAGFLDGEGCIGIHFQKSTQTHYIKVTAPQAEPKSLQILQGLFGGTFRVKAYKLEKPNHRRMYIWEVAARQAYEMLLIIEPFLVVKREQAELAIKFQQGVGRAISRSISNEERERRERIRQQISALNQGVGQRLLL